MSLRDILLVRALLPACLHASFCAAQPPPPAPSAPNTVPRPPEVSFHMERTGLAVPVYTLRVAEDGAAEYFGQELVTAPNSAPSDPRPFRKQIRLGAAATTKIFAGAKSLNQFQVKCSSNAKNIADTGAKTLSYAGPDGQGSCTFNYSENKTVQSLTDTFQAVANTMDIGRKLEFQHRFDRLGLDAETASLAKALESGQAAEVLTIASTLESIAGDTEVIQRVRFRAARLLQTAKDSQ